MSEDSKACEALKLNDEDTRIVLVGKTGAGKSATGNTILGSKVFECKFAAQSLTVNCKKARGEVDGRNVAVVDTPGLFDTKFSEDKTLREIKQCICLSSPGPHVFLIVIKLGRFTEEEQETAQMIQKVFGQTSTKYTMILLTHGDQLEDEIVEEIVKNTPKLQELISKCEGGYHVFNNKSKDPSQVTGLLEKINNMVLKNGGSHYTNEMFQEAEKAIEEEKQRILKANEEKRHEEEKDLKTKYKGEALKKAMNMLKEQYEKEAREKAEIANKFIHFGLVAAYVGLGASIGLMFGPTGVAVGSAVGGVLGVAAAFGGEGNLGAPTKGVVFKKVSAAVGKAVLEKGKCITQ